METPTTTAAQRKAIEQQAAFYDSDDCHCAGLDHYTVEFGTDWGAGEATVAVKFHYRYECEGHYPGPHDPMGVTVYCDGSCQHMGLEVTIFDLDGNVTSSQDYG